MTKEKGIKDQKEHKFYKQAAESVASFLNSMMDRSESTETDDGVVRKLGIKRQNMRNASKTNNLNVSTGAYKSGKTSKAIKKSLKKEIDLNSSILPAKTVQKAVAKANKAIKKDKAEVSKPNKKKEIKEKKKLGRPKKNVN